MLHIEKHDYGGILQNHNNNKSKPLCKSDFVVWGFFQMIYGTPNIAN